MGTVNIDVIKLRTSQNKDGDTLTVRLNPADEIARDAILLARPGSQFKMTLIDLDEDGNADAGNRPPAREAEARLPPVTGPASRLTEQPCVASAMGEYWCVGKCQNPKDCSATPRPARASRLTKQAEDACDDPLFWSFLRKHDIHLKATANINEEAAVAVRLICHVKSRREFIPGTSAGDRWEELYGKFIAWRDEPDAA
jgi:hypothetical protein